MRRHGDTQYFIPGEGVVGAPENAVSRSGRSAESDFDEERAFRFSRLFPNLPALESSQESLAALGEVMEDNTDPLRDHQTIPGGYTYLGQFIDHDITHDPTQGFPSEGLSPEQIVNGRTPGLDLDSMYGLGPDDETKAIYEDDGMTLRIGNTTPVGGADFSAPNDLPRGGQDDPLAADIGDPRNDENLAVAQTHLAMLKFHNKVLASLPEDDDAGTSRGARIRSEKMENAGSDGDEDGDDSSQEPDPVLTRFEQARRTVTLHYQWIVLHDFVKRLVIPDVLDDVLQNGRRFYRINEGDEPGMPVEFSVATYRLGHSMIREFYNWNVTFPNASLGDLFDFSGVSGDMFGMPSLPSNWIANWVQMYDFSPAIGLHPQMNQVRNIDTHLSLTLHNLPNFPNENVPFTSLAVMNLVRGGMLGLPSGQAVAEAMGEVVLTPQQISEGEHQATIQAHSFDTQTPLWYYVLKEAEVAQDGQRMGPVGSRITAEVFAGLVEASRISILKEPDWRPTLPSRIAGEFDMADLLMFVDDLHPLEDQVG